mmetsp:Transcript_39225/g.28967  ORF Transcript_39225/g.28967 Transcript_39225/m.28967 type:complete len:88 (-) Transcript_39225:133-396(-)
MQKYKGNTLIKITTCTEQYQKDNWYSYTNIDIKGLSVYPNEDEVIYPPISTFGITSIKKVGDHYEIEMQEQTGQVYHMMREMIIDDE